MDINNWKLKITNLFTLSINNVVSISKFVIIDLISVIFNTVGKRVLKIDDEIVRDVKLIEDRIEFYLHSINVNEVEQIIDLNKLIIHSGNITGTIMTIPKKFWTDTTVIQIEMIQIICSLEKSSDSIYFSTVEEQNRFLSSDETNPDLQTIMIAIRDLLVSYFNNIQVKINNISVLLNNIEISLQNIQINHELMLIESFQIQNIVIVTGLEFSLDSINLKYVEIKSSHFTCLPNYYYNSQTGKRIKIMIDDLYFDDLHVSKLSIHNTISVESVSLDNLQLENVLFTQESNSYISDRIIKINFDSTKTTLIQSYAGIIQSLESHFINEEHKEIDLLLQNLHIMLNVSDKYYELQTNVRIHGDQMIFDNFTIIVDNHSLSGKQLIILKNEYILHDGFIDLNVENHHVDGKIGFLKYHDDNIICSELVLNLSEITELHRLKQIWSGSDSEDSNKQWKICISDSEFTGTHKNYNIGAKVEMTNIIYNSVDFTVYNTSADLSLDEVDFCKINIASFRKNHVLINEVHFHVTPDTVSHIGNLFESDKIPIVNNVEHIHLDLLQDALNECISSSCDDTIVANAIVEPVENFIDMIKIKEPNFKLDVIKMRFNFYMDDVAFITIIIKNSKLCLRNDIYDIVIDDFAILDNTCGSRKWKYFLRKRSTDKAIKMFLKTTPESIRIEMILADSALKMRERTLCTISKFIESTWMFVSESTNIALISKFSINALKITLDYDPVMRKDDIFTINEYVISLPQVVMYNIDGYSKLLDKYSEKIKVSFDYDEKLQFIPHLRAIKSVLFPIYNMNDKIRTIANRPSNKRKIKTVKKTVRSGFYAATKFAKYIANATYSQINNSF